MSEDKNLQNKSEDVKDDEVKNEIKEDGKIIEESKLETENNTVHRKNKIKTIIITGVIGVLCLGSGFVVGKEMGRKLPATNKSYPSSKVMATVGDTKITGENMQKKMEPLFYLNGKEQMSEEEITAYEASMLDYMTTTEVLYLEGKSQDIKVTDEEVEQEYSTLMASIEEKFSMKEDEFLKKFKLTKEYIKKELEKELIAIKYVGEASEVSDKEAKNYYDKNKDEYLEVKASHILLKNIDDEGNEVSEEQKAANKKEAEKILKSATSGEDFATLAKQYSQDTSASSGGDLGFFGKGQMVEAFEKAVYELKVGEVKNEVVETEFGYHIIKKTDEQYKEFDEIKDEIKTNLSYEKQNNLIMDLTEKYNVDIKE